jgi:hypothetical protein
MVADNQSMQAGNWSNESKDLAPQAETHFEECTGQLVSHWQVFVDNLPYAAMIILGAAIFLMGMESGFWRWLLAGMYLAYGLAGAFWIMLFICPYCHFYDTRLCPCGYGIVAAKLRSKKDNATFPQQFKKHIPVVVPLWFIPLIAGVIFLFSDFSWILLGVLIAFVVNSHLFLPLLARQYGCASCPQKETCPWMGCGK